MEYLKRRLIWNISIRRHYAKLEKWSTYYTSKTIEQSKTSDIATDIDSNKTVTTDQSEAPDKSVEKEPNETEPATEDQTPVQKPKIKIGTGRPKRKTRSKAKSSSESDTLRYSMRIKPTLRCLSSGGRALRSLRAINYQETYDYHTGRSREKPKNVVVPPAARTEPSVARQAAQAAIKDPSLLGAMPAQTIPVLVLHNNVAEDSDNTIVYDDVEAESEDPPPQPDQTQMTDDHEEQPGVEETVNISKNTQKPKVKGSLRVKRYVIRRPKQKKKTKKYKCTKCVNKYDSIRTLNRHFRKQHRRVRCPDCGKLCTTLESL